MPYFEDVAQEDEVGKRPKLSTQEQYMRDARTLWGSPAELRLALLREKDIDIQLYESVRAVFTHQFSSYRARLRDPRMIEQYEAKLEKQVRDAYAVLLRRRSAHIIPLSVWCRTISYYNQRTPTRVWNDQQAGLKIGAAQHWHTRVVSVLTDFACGCCLRSA